jgi:5-methylphenazine-1-carboxylate 1-monooxygenase
LMESVMDVLIIGGGIGGLTLALALQERGIACRVFEQATEIKALGVGVNLLPHSMKHLTALGLAPAIARIAVETVEATFFNRFGQHIYAEPLGKRAGYEWPQYSVHRGDLHLALLAAFKERVGADRLHLGQRCVAVEQDANGVTARFEATEGGASLPAQHAPVAIACDGIHSAVRKQLYPTEGDPRYTGVNMWRGVTRWKPFLAGANMTRVGWMTPAKLVIYPIRNNVDAEGRQLINWVVEIETDHYKSKRDWNRPGNVEDFMPVVADWHFPWLDVPALFRAADVCLEYPMVDQEPLPRWSFDRVTLLGDAAHPMAPRGSNGAGQSIIDAVVLAEELANHGLGTAALKAYEERRLEPTSNVVRENRKNPPDAILREVYERTGDRPFDRIEDVMTREEMVAITDRYKRIAGYDPKTLQGAARIAP